MATTTPAATRGKSRGTILVIDDERDLVELVRYNVEREGFDVIAAIDGPDGLDIARKHRPDVIVLDVMMPGMDGLDVCRELRKDPATERTPVIMLTARASESDRVVGLELGADDYLTKPFSPRELVARVKAVLRRTQQQTGQTQAVRRGRLVLDPARHEVTWDGRPVSLTATEFRILRLLASKAGRVLSRDEIIDAALGRDAAVFDRTIDVHMTAIRKKLGAGGDQIETVRGFGYKLRDRPQQDDD
jgi:two-component system, OmpR family, alkaline phosphatase synthesis response regulator PhoP